ncbi:MAG: B12-binding domain-containing radical SAM protein [Candidatus Aminicenantales bacterium]
MSYERVLFVNPPSKAEWKGIRPHLGLGYLAQTLKEQGFHYEVIDMNFGYRLEHVLRKIEDYKPQLLGMTLISLEYKKSYQFLSTIKEFFPDLKIAVGGPHLTLLKEEVLKECKAVDYGVIYEGEKTLIELCQGNSPQRIKGIMFREDGDIFSTGNYEFEMDLDRIPWPRYDKFELSRYIPEIDIYSSRGCVFQCIFCPNRKISPVYRMRSAENVVDEIEYWSERGYRQFNFDDDNFNFSRQRVLRICDEIERRGLRNLFLRCSNGLRADRIDREILIRMKEVGFKYIAFGVEGGNDKILAVLKKGETMEQIEEAVRNAIDLNYDVKLLFIVGGPYETREDIEDRVKFSLRYPVQDVHFYNIIPYPGTELFDWIKKNNYFLIQPGTYLNDISCLDKIPVFETPELREKERIEIFNYLERIRRKINKKAIQRFFGKKGFLGKIVSSIVLNSFTVKLFYGNFFIRKFIEKIRYKKALK